MTGRYLRFAVALCAFTVASCGKDAPSPSSPSPTTAISGEAAADGSTLKASAPTPQSPINGAEPTISPVVLVIVNSTAKFGDAAFLYRFEIFNSAGTLVGSGVVGSGPGATTSYEVAVELEGEKPYEWRARAEYQGAFGPWSSRAAFVAPTTDGYVRGNELYDPLNNGKTIGQIHGPVTFLPGVGVRLESPVSYISYQLQQTLENGEISALITNMPQNTEGSKTKVFAMADGFADLVTNRRRMTVEKRGDPQGHIAWRFRPHFQEIIDTVGSERVGYPFQASLVYYFRATWLNGQFRLTINEGGVNGRQIYSFGKGYSHVYDPETHVIYIGSPPTQSGPENQSIEFMVIRQLWVSSRPRPGFAKK